MDGAGRSRGWLRGWLRLDFDDCVMLQLFLRSSKKHQGDEVGPVTSFDTQAWQYELGLPSYQSISLSQPSSFHIEVSQTSGDL